MVASGATETVPEAATSPIPLLIVTRLALVVAQLRVAVCPFVIVAGVTPNTSQLATGTVQVLVTFVSTVLLYTQSLKLFNSLF